VPTLYLLRHAKSSWDDATLADRDRPLSTRGRKAAKRVREHLQSERIRPELVLCSPATRARETLERVAPALGARTRIEIEGSLYGASAESLAARLRLVPDDVRSVMLIGHNPGIHDLALALAGRGEPLRRIYEKLPTGALVTIELPGRWSELAAGQGELTSFVSPRELRG
jgi:phosphohistidine phosphatase